MHFSYKKGRRERGLAHPGGVRSRMVRSTKYSAGTLWLCVVVSPCSLQHVECEAQFMEGGTEMIFRHILA